MSDLSTSLNYGNKKISVLELGFTIYLIAACLLPQIKAFTSFIVFDLIILFYIIYVSWNDSRCRKEAFRFVMIIAFIALLYTLLNDASSISSHVAFSGFKRFVSKFNQYLLMFFPLCVFYRVSTCANKRQIGILLLMTILFALYGSINTLRVLNTNDMAARHNSFTEEVDESILGYSHIYCFSFLALLFYQLVIIGKQKCRFVAIVLFFMTFYFLFKAQFMLAMVTTLISMTYITIHYCHSNVLKFLFVIGVVAVFAIIPAMMDFLIESTNSDFLKMRLAEIRDFFLFERDEDSDLFARLDLYWLSIKAFFSSPIWGHRTLPFDGHATLLMCFADLGILGGIPIWYLLIRAYKLTKMQMGVWGYYFVPFFLQIILNGLTNPIHSQSANYIILWFFVPFVIIKYVPNRSSMV